jgi:hypothetical protein
MGDFFEFITEAFVAEVYAEETPTTSKAIEIPVSGKQAPEAYKASATEKEYGFDEEQIPNVTENKYAKVYFPGDYQTEVEVFAGKVAFADYDEQGPKPAKESVLNPGDRAVAKQAALPTKTPSKKVRVTVVVPKTAKGKFIVKPYDKQRLRYEQAIILNPGDIYTEIREIK